MLDQLTMSEYFFLAVSAGLIAYITNTFLRLGHIRMRREIAELRGRLEAIEERESGSVSPLD
jgi:hypothetical protein